LEKFFRKYRKIGILLLVLNFLFTSSAFGQQMLPDYVLAEREAAEREAEIFPFSSLEFEEEPVSDEELAERTLEYTEDFYEVTEEGVFDAEGNEVDVEAVRDKPAIPKKEEVDDEMSAFEAYRESIMLNWGGKRAFTEKRLEGIRENLKEEKRNFVELEKEIGEVESKLEPLQKEIETLKEHIVLLNHQLVESKNKIKSAEYLIAEKQIALRDLMWELKQSEIELDIQQQVVLDYIVLVYQEEEKFLDVYNETSSTLKLLLADNSVSENLLGQEYLEILEETGRKVFYDLHDKKVALEEKREEIQREQQKLDELYQSLNQERRILEQGRSAKKELLEDTLGQEERYQQLLEESIQQQLESAIAIQNMHDNIEFIEAKLDLLDESLEKAEELAENPEKAEELLEIEIEVEEKQEETEEEYFSDDEEEAEDREYVFLWPVPPFAITAYFHDPTYPKKWGIHNAVDIRAKQFTEITAPANGYVFQTKDNGMGYSYIILAHKNKLITVYGHVTELIAKPGTVVREREIIGLTGGTPGTKGSGWQTTGPHLHFEVWHNGKQVDPLDYLPVYDLPIEYIPDKYIEMLEMVN